MLVVDDLGGAVVEGAGSRDSKAMLGCFCMSNGYDIVLMSFLIRCFVNSSSPAEKYSIFARIEDEVSHAPLQDSTV